MLGGWSFLELLFTAVNCRWGQTTPHLLRWYRSGKCPCSWLQVSFISPAGVNCSGKGGKNNYSILWSTWLCCRFSWVSHKLLSPTENVKSKKKRLLRNVSITSITERHIGWAYQRHTNRVPVHIQAPFGPENFQGASKWVTPSEFSTCLPLVKIPKSFSDHIHLST